MSINIKQADGLKRLSQTIEFYKSNSNISIPQLFTGSYNDLTDKPIVDGTAIIESIETTQSSFYVQDENGNTIALIDNQGVHSIDFYANGESVKQHMSSSIDQLNNLSGSLDTHKANSTIHITSDEREKWNDPLSEEGDTLYINDALGNTIAIFDANGLTTTNVTIKFNGEALEISSKLTEIDNRLTSIQNKNNDQDGRLDGLETATEKLDFIDASESDNTFSIVDTHGNPIAQFDASGLTTTEVTIANAEGSPIQVGAKIEGVEGRVSTAEGEIDTLQGQLQTLGNNFSSHVDDTTVHITASERSTWNTVTSKADQSDLNTTNQNLATEITNRQNADSTLQSNIEAEAQIRANEDTAINERTAEIEASENGVLSITDPSGNPIAQFDENGLLVTAIQTTNDITVGGNFDSKELSADNIVSRGDIESHGEVKGVTIIATGNVSAADVKTNAITSLNSTISTINNNASALESRVSTAEGEIVTLQTQTSTLIASDSGKSVRTIANEELAAALIPSDAQESLNTLQEIADWIQDHPEDAAQMNKDIAANTKAINDHINNAEPRFNALEEKTANIEDSAESDAFIIYDKNNQPGFQVDASGTTVHTLKADNATVVNKISVGSMSVGGVEDVENKLTDIDGAIQDLAEDLQGLSNDLRPNSHSHSNKSLLDTYDQTNDNIKNAVDKAHSHNNKTVLDNTTASFTIAEQTKLGALPNKSELDGLFNNKQDNLTAGNYIDISNNTISVKDLPYSELENIPTDIVHDANYVHTDNNFTDAYQNQLDNIADTYVTEDEFKAHNNETKPRIESLEEKTANIEDSAESDVFTIYDKNDQPGFQIDANGAFIGTLNVNDVVTHNTITTSKLSVGEIVDLEEKINSVDQDIADINTQVTTNKNNLSTEITDRTNADTQIRTDFTAADTQIRTDFTAADSKLKSDLQGEIDSDVSSHNTSTSAHSDIRALFNNKQDNLTAGSYIDITNNTISVKDLPYSALKDIPANIVIDDDYNHTDNNFTDTYKTQLDGISTTYATKGELTTHQNNAESTYRKISDSYNKTEVDGKIPTVNNAKLTIQKNGVDVTTFTANSASDATANITVPTKVTDLSDADDYALANDLTAYRLISDSYTKGEVDEKIPTVNDATLTIQKNGTNITTFSANSSTNTTANITVPTTVAELTDSSNYALTTSLNDYRLTSESYSKTEVDALIDPLPKENTTYDFTNNGSKLTITPSSGESKTLDLSTNLSNYYTKNEIETWINNQAYANEGYVDSEVTLQLSEALKSYYTKSQTYSKTEIDALINNSGGSGSGSDDPDDPVIITANSFVNMVVGTTTISATSSIDTLTFEAGTNIKLVGNAENKTITIKSCTEGAATSDGSYPLIVQHPMYQGQDHFYTATDATYDKYGVITANGFASGDYSISALGIDPSSENGEQKIEFDTYYNPYVITSEGAWIINSALNVTNEIFENDQRVASRTWVSDQLNSYILLQDMEFVSYHQNATRPLLYSFGGPEVAQTTAMQLVYAQGSDDNFGFFYMQSDQIDADQHPDPSYQIANLHAISNALAQYVSKTSIGYYTNSNLNIEFSIGSNNTTSPNKSLIYRSNTDGAGSFYYEPNEEISQELNADTEIATLGDISSALQNYATEEYVNNNLQDYATEGYVDSEVTFQLDEALTNYYTKSEIDEKIDDLGTETNVDFSNQEVDGDSWQIVDNANNVVAQIDKNGLTITQINVQSDTDNFVKNFTFSDYGFYELDNHRDKIRTINIDIPAEDSWECFYEYFRQDIFQMNKDNIESCVGYFTRDTRNWMLPTKLNTYFSDITEDIDSFKIELLGAAEAAAECSMIVTVYTTSAITYSLQIYHSSGNYVTNGWRCDNIKTINGESLYGIGNIDLEGTGGTGSSAIIDDSLSTVSTNPVQNKVITNAINSKANITDLRKYALDQTTSPYYSYKYSQTAPYFTRVNADGEDVEAISTDISLSIDEAPASNPYSILYEYFRTTVLKMNGHYGQDGNIIQNGPITATAQFIPGNNMYVDLGLSVKLQSWFASSISENLLLTNGPIYLDSFKVELLGGPNTAAECTMIITAYTKRSESYELQVVATENNYISKGWVKKDYHNYATTDYVDNATPQFATYLGDNFYGGWQLYLSKIDQSHRNKLDSSWNLCPPNLQPIQLDPGTYLAIIDVVNSHSNMGNYCTSYTDIITIAEGLGAGGGAASYHVENCTGKVHTYCSYRYETPYQMSSVRLQSDYTYGYNIIQAFVSEGSSSTMTYDLMLPSTTVFNKERVSCRVWIKKIISPSWDLPIE